MSDDQKGKNPWGSRPSSTSGPKNANGESPWGKPKNSNTGGPRPNKPKGNEPNIDDMIKQAQERLGAFFGGGQNGGGGNKGSGGARSDGTQLPPIPYGKIIILVIVLYALTGFYRVLPEENAVVKTFGAWTSTKDLPGLGYHIPWPIQTIEKVNVTFERRIEIGFRGSGGRFASTDTAIHTRTNVDDIPSESLMLTGDENIINIDFVVLWRVQDAGNYLFAIRDPENTIKKVAESAMREVIGRTMIQSALTEARAQIEQDTKALMQQMLDDYRSGVLINDVQLQQVDPPRPVIDAFDDVQRARADMERLRNEAEAYRNDILPRARGTAEKILQDAEGYRAEVVNRATGDADRFSAVFRAYDTDRTITARRLYIETMEDVLRRTNKIIISGEGGTGNILPYLPLNELRGGRSGSDANATTTPPASQQPAAATVNTPRLTP